MIVFKLYPDQTSIQVDVHIAEHRLDDFNAVAQVAWKAAFDGPQPCPLCSEMVDGKIIDKR